MNARAIFKFQNLDLFIPSGVNFVSESSHNVLFSYFNALKFFWVFQVAPDPPVVSVLAASSGQQVAPDPRAVSVPAVPGQQTSQVSDLSTIASLLTEIMNRLNNLERQQPQPH